MRIKKVNEHIDGCFAVKNYKSGQWDTPWAYITSDYIRLDTLGRKTRGMGEKWLKIICNCADCPAYLLVAESDLLHIINKEAEGR